MNQERPFPHPEILPAWSTVLGFLHHLMSQSVHLFPVTSVEKKVKRKTAPFSCRRHLSNSVLSNKDQKTHHTLKCFKEEGQILPVMKIASWLRKNLQGWTAGESEEVGTRDLFVLLNGASFSGFGLCFCRARHKKKEGEGKLSLERTRDSSNYFLLLTLQVVSFTVSS